MATALNRLTVASLIAVGVSLSPQSAQAQNLNTMLTLSNTPVIDVLERYRIYTNLASVVADFPLGGDPVEVATAYFSQNPRPRQLIIGRWARGASSGQLRAASGASVAKTIANWNAVTAGAFSWQVDGAAVSQVTGMNFSSVLDYNGVAAVIDAALSTADCAYNPVYDRFEFISHSTGTTSSLTFLGSPASGTDISGFLLGRGGANSGAYTVAGIGAENAKSVAALFDQLIGRQFYAMTGGFVSDSDVFQFGQYVQSANNKHVYVHTTDDPTALLTTDTTSLAYQLHQAGMDRVFIQWATDDHKHAGVTSFARLLTVDYAGSNTAITLMYKQDPGQTPEYLTATQAAVLKSKGVNVFAAYDNNTNILQYGTMASGIFADQRTAADWLATTLETAQFNALYTTLTRIPQTDDGMHLLKTTSENVLSQAVRNGICAPGTWNSDGFGILKNGDFLPTGFYVYQGPVAEQSEEDRTTRVATPQQIACKLAGAVHSVDVSVVLNP